MARRAASPGVQPSGVRGEDVTGRATTWLPTKELVMAPSRLSRAPWSNGRTLALTAERSRSESWRGNQSSVGTGAAATAPAPDHHFGIGPRRNDPTVEYSETLAFAPPAVGPILQTMDWTHEHSPLRQTI